MSEKESLDGITDQVIGAAIQVHRALGPGLLESAYEACLVFELTDRGLSVEQQKPLPIVYRKVKIDTGYRLDLVVDESRFLKRAAHNGLRVELQPVFQESRVDPTKVLIGNQIAL